MFLLRVSVFFYEYKIVSLVFSCPTETGNTVFFFLLLFLTCIYSGEWLVRVKSCARNLWKKKSIGNRDGSSLIGFLHWTFDLPAGKLELGARRNSTKGNVNAIQQVSIISWALVVSRLTNKREKWGITSGQVEHFTSNSPTMRFKLPLQLNKASCIKTIEIIRRLKHLESGTASRITMFFTVRYNWIGLLRFLEPVSGETMSENYSAEGSSRRFLFLFFFK